MSLLLSLSLLNLFPLILEFLSLFLLRLCILLGLLHYLPLSLSHEYLAELLLLFLELLLELLILDSLLFLSLSDLFLITAGVSISLSSSCRRLFRCRF